MESKVFRNLALSLAGRAGFSRISAEVLVQSKCRILVIRKHTPAKFRTFDCSSLMNMPCLERPYSAALAIRASYHADTLSAAGAVVTAVSCTDRATHIIRSLLTDQIIAATTPQKTARMADRMSFWITDMMRQLIAESAKMHANKVISADAQMPIALTRAFNDGFIG